MKICFVFFLVLPCALETLSQGQNPGPSAGTTQYGQTTPADVKKVMDQVLNYLDAATPVGIVNRITGESVSDLKNPIIDATLAKSEYSITSHEWGLAYSGMLMAGGATGDPRYTDYVRRRFEFLGRAAPYFRAYEKNFPGEANPLGHFLNPQSLDDTGSMCAAIIQAIHMDMANTLQQEAEHSINYIMNRVHRLPDGTFGRNRPLPNAVWVDDLYQGIPALAQMGKLKGDEKYFDEAVKQVFLFSGKLFDKTKGVCMHGWVEGMEPHPAFYWARANGWAIMAIAALLDVLPESHSQYKAVLKLFKDYCHGLASLQSGSGFWHQLLDRNDSFLETSATAMFTYVFAFGINKGWLNVQVYGPAALLGWNAVRSKVNEKGQVEGTSAGTSMAFDPAFYYQRPVGTGPHGYGSVLLAGATVFTLLTNHPYEKNGPVIFKK